MKQVYHFVGRDGKRVQLRFVPWLGRDEDGPVRGKCDAAARIIWIRLGLSPAETLGTIWHEIMHLLDPDATEEFVYAGEAVFVQAAEILADRNVGR